MKKYLSILASITPFSVFSEEVLGSYFQPGAYRLLRYEKGQLIHLQDEICRRLDVVLEGKAGVQKIDEEGNVLKIDVTGPGGILGANLLFASRNVYPMTIVAENPVTLLHIEKVCILQMCKDNDGFMAEFLRVVSDRTLVLTDTIKAISMKTIRQKLLDYLRFESAAQNSRVIRLAITKKELAERFGVRRSSLSRELNKMRADGLISFDAKTITLR